MTKFVVKLALSRKNVPAKIQLGREVALSMTGNPNFAAPNPPLVDLTAATDALETAYNNFQSAGGGTALSAIVREKEDEFDVVITNMGRYVDITANGSETIIRSAGMDVKKEREPAQVPAAATDLNGSPGALPQTVDLKWKRPKFGLVALIYMSDAPPAAAVWNLVGETTKSSFTVTGLTSLREYLFYVVIISTAGKSPSSDQASSAAL